MPLRRSVIAVVLAVGLPVVGFSPAHAAALPAPTGLVPAGSDAGSTPTLSWERVAGATGYHVEVDDSADFSSVAFAVTTTNKQAVPTSHLPSGLVFWRVRAEGSGIVSGWSQETFRVQPVDVPQLTSPADGAPLSQPNDPPLLTWSPVTGAISYEVEVDPDGDWIGAAKYTVKGTGFVVPTPQGAGTYHWRVRTLLDRNLVSEWSGPRSYTVDPLADPVLRGALNRGGVPAGDNETVQDVVLDWDPVPGAQKYELRVGLNEDFSQLVGNRTIMVAGTRYSPPITYDNDQYFWQVRAINAAGEPTPWQDVVARFHRDWPQQPSLVYPVDGISTPVGDDLYFQWTPVRHATSYDLEVGWDRNFSPNTYRTCTTSSTTYTVFHRSDPCAPGSAPVPGQGGQIFWRVRAKDGPSNVVGIYSEIRSFVYETRSVTQTRPAAGESLVVPTLTWGASRYAEKYYVEVRDSSGQRVASDFTYALSWTPHLQALAEGTYAWTVQAVDLNGRKSPLYPARSFTISGAPVADGDPLTPLTGIATDGPSTRPPGLSWEPYPNAAKYQVHVKVAGSGFELGATPTAPLVSAKVPYPAVTDWGSYFLAPGSYEWWIEAFDTSGASLASGPRATFTISDLPAVTGQALALDGEALDEGKTCDRAVVGEVTDEDICLNVPATPVLDWDPVSGAAFYMVYLANDRELTNPVYTTPRETMNTRWTPRDADNPRALADNISGQAYYWFVRPCKAVSACAPDPVGVANSASHAFRKQSVKPILIGPVNNSTQANDLSFDWADYEAPNQVAFYEQGPNPSPQRAKQYLIEVSRTNRFTEVIDRQVVDQSAYTSFLKTYPEGDLYWRVAVIDAQGNQLSWSDTWHVTKSSPSVVLDQFPDDEKQAGSTRFNWTARPFNARYDLEVYKNPDEPLSPGNLVLSARNLQQTAYVSPNNFLQPSVNAYRWRVRWTDASGNQGPWSPVDRFFVRAEIPAPISPAPGSEQVPMGPLYQWGGVASAARYQLSVRNLSTGSSQTVNTVATAWAATQTLSSGDYEWQVSALDANGAVIGSSTPARFSVHGQPTVLTPGTITGSGQVGTPLSATMPSWAPTGVTTSVQWVRDGQPIAGATGKTYQVNADDLSRSIQARFTGSKSGYPDTVVVSNSIRATEGAAIQNVSRPSVAGTPRVGQTLTGTPGSWQGHPTYTYQWLRAGAPISGATAASYTVDTDDAGRALTLRVTAHQSGYANGTATSADVAIDKVKSRTRTSLAKKRVPPKRRAVVIVKVRAAGFPAPTGRVRIYDRRHKLKTVRLTTTKEGRVRVRLPRLDRGRHRISARYTGMSQIKASRSRAVTLRVTR